MAASSSTYYGFTRVREAGPELQDWAAIDANWELVSLVLKQMETHTHTGATPFHYPGYNAGTPTVPTLPTLTSYTTGGILSPGTTIGVRLSYVNALGLETDAAPETTITVDAAAARPLAPILTSVSTAASALPGGTYIYAVTKVKGSGETQISDIVTVDVPFDNTYQVTLTIDAINTYTDGTTAINIYRSAGLNATFQLAGTVTSTSATTFVDNNTILSANVNRQPPTISTFDAARKVRVDWSALTHPSGASKLRVYLTQQAGLWGTSNLLTEIDLSGTPANYVDYIGNEVLGTGWPRSTSEIPASPAKINLGAEATGAPILTADMDFAGFQAKNLVLQNTVSPPTTNGTIYYDTSIPTVRARINGAWVNWGTTTASAYTHPAEESGGHIAANIKYKAGSAITSKTIFDTMRNTSDGSRKNATGISKAVGAAAVTGFVSTSPTLLTDMTLSITPDFDNQWYEVVFGGHFTASAFGMNVSVGIEQDSVLIEETIRTLTAPGTSSNIFLTTAYTFQSNTVAAGAKTTRVLWWVDTGTATAVTTRRSLVVKRLF